MCIVELKMIEHKCKKSFMHTSLHANQSVLIKCLIERESSKADKGNVFCIAHIVAKKSQRLIYVY